GQFIDVSVTLTSLRDDGGKVNAVAAAERDITQRKQTEEAVRHINMELEERVDKRNKELESIVAGLQRGQQYIERLTNTVPAVIYIFDIGEKQISYVNAHVREMLGYGPEAIRRMKVDELLELLHPQDEHLLRKNFDTVAKQRTGDRIDVEFRVPHPNRQSPYFHT